MGENGFKIKAGICGSTGESSEKQSPPINVELHQKILDEMHDLYKRKNNDYGDSFHLLFQEEGMAAVRIRLGDKLNRFKTMTKPGHKQTVTDESVRDTLMDLANYSIMAIIEMDRQAIEASKSEQTDREW